MAGSISEVNIKRYIKLKEVGIKIVRQADSSIKELKVRDRIVSYHETHTKALPKAILYRKNSLFYKTPQGAYVGDLFMSLIHTCCLCKANPFQYLKALQDNSSLIAKNPQKWMPRNYREMLSNTEE